MTLPVKIAFSLFFAVYVSTVISSQKCLSRGIDPAGILITEAKVRLANPSVTSRPPKKRKIRYRPPKRGAPQTREASAARGDEDMLPKVTVLAPMHTGLTNRVYPMLAWHQDKAARATFVLTLTNEDSFDTLMELKFTKHAPAGIHQFDLSSLELSLETAVEYRWSIGVISGDEHASGDPYSAAHIKKVVRSDELARQLKTANQFDRIAILAEQSIWYDALAELSDRIAVSPDDLSLRKLRTQLLADAEVFNGRDKNTKALARPDKSPQIKSSSEEKAIRQPGKSTQIKSDKSDKIKSAAKNGASNGLVASIAGKSRRVSYRPPKRGAPLTREASAARGAEDLLPNLFVLAPKHTGWTTQAHPTLYWYQDKDAKATFLLTLRNEDTLETLMELRFTRQSTAGIHSFDLSCLDMSLVTDVEYGWSIGVISGDEHASGDPYSAAHIRKITTLDELAGQLKEVNKLDRITILAEHGIWYDTLEELSKLMASSPKDRFLQDLRSQLLTDAEVFNGQDMDNRKIPEK